MKDIYRENKDLMQSIQESMFVFDNLSCRMIDRLITVCATDTELLVLALKGQTSRCAKSCLAVCPGGAANIVDEMVFLALSGLLRFRRHKKKLSMSRARCRMKAQLFWLAVVGMTLSRTGLLA